MHNVYGCGSASYHDVVHEDEVVFLSSVHLFSNHPHHIFAVFRLGYGHDGEPALALQETKHHLPVESRVILFVSEISKCNMEELKNTYRDEDVHGMQLLDIVFIVCVLVMVIYCVDGPIHGR